MQEQPRAESQGLHVLMFVKNPCQVSIKDEPLNFKPNNPFTCVDATVKAAAEQKPEITGADMNSTMKPILLKTERRGFVLL